jgi:flagellar basal-body rod modification protein FlgD
MNIASIFSPPAVAPAQTGGKKELGQEDFLKLLVAQLKNQDPSSPADNAEFLSQIAQFSMVSGIDKLGTSFNGIAGSFYTTQAMQASELVGRQVLVDSDAVTLEEGATTDGVLQVPEFAELVKIQVLDQSGELVKTLDPGDYRSGTSVFTWDGSNEAGDVLSEGAFTIAATALVDGTQQALPVQLYHTVDSIAVKRGDNSVELRLRNDQQVPFSHISQYR